MFPEVEQIRLVYLRELRAPFFVAVILPTLLGTAIAHPGVGGIRALPLLLCLLGTVMIHGGSNVVNDLFDYRSGTDRVNRNRGPLNGGSPFLLSGELSQEEVKRLAIALYSVGGASAVLLSLLVGWIVLPLFLAGGAIGYLYTHPSGNLAGRGLGEVAVWFAFGPLAVGTAYCAQTAVVSLEAVVMGVPMGFLVAGVILVNEIPDALADRLAGKWHLVVRLGGENAGPLFRGFMLAAFLPLPASVAVGAAPPSLLAGLAGAPLAWKCCRWISRDEIPLAQRGTVMVMVVAGGAMSLSQLFL